VLDEPAVRARCAGAGLPVGERVRVRLLAADVAARQVRFERADASGS
jgi:exoribonuclease R